MVDPKVNGGIHGHLRYNPELIKAIEKEMEKLKMTYPISDIRVYLTDISDKRWNGNGGVKCKECDVDAAGYKSSSLCGNCNGKD